MNYAQDQPESSRRLNTTKERNRVLVDLLKFKKNLILLQSVNYRLN